MRELYDLTIDPGELTNIAEDQTDLTGDLEKWLETWIAENLSRLGRTEDPLRAQGITLGKRWDAFVGR